jgi:1-acyl-sn-glycerol-3-phosphate acyltransferase
MVDSMVQKFNTSDHLQLAITPEGTRSRVTKWRTGFLHIARQANVPIVLGVLDYKTKVISLTTTFTPSGDSERDMREIKRFYRGTSGRYPEKFSTDDED